VWCSVLQCVAVCCSVLQCVAVCCSASRDYTELVSREGLLAILLTAPEMRAGDTWRASASSNAVVCCSVLQCVALCFSVHEKIHGISNVKNVPVFSCEFACFRLFNYYSVLQCVAVCCSVLLCVVVYCSMLQCVAVCCSVLQCVAVWCSVLQCVAVWCSVLQCVAVCCSVLHCTQRIAHMNEGHRTYECALLPLQMLESSNCMSHATQINES